MKIVKKDGKTYLVGTTAEVGRVLTRQAKKNLPVDLGWSLSTQADVASAINGERYACNDCHYEGLEATFTGGACPECVGKNLAKA